MQFTGRGQQKPPRPGSQCFLAKNFLTTSKSRGGLLLWGCRDRGRVTPFRFRKHSFTRAAHNGKAVAQKRYGNRQTTSSTPIERPKNANRLCIVSTMGRGASQKRMRCAEHPVKREMARRARPRARPENPRRYERLDHHNRAHRVRPRTAPLYKMTGGTEHALPRSDV
jgi:hypothetical protein